MADGSYWRDPDFQQKLVSFVCRDRNLLQECAHLLEPDDFKPRREQPPELWIIATAALDFWRKYREPIGGMLRAELMHYARQMNYTDRQRTRLLEVAVALQRNHSMIAATALSERVLDYKRERLKSAAVQQLVELQEQGRLTDEKWLEVCMKGVDQFGVSGYRAVDYFAGLDQRTERRVVCRGMRYPYLMIDPFDELVRAIARGQLGAWLSFAKMGKSIALIHTALAYTIQALNVLYFTLEDPRAETEDRFDSAISALPMKQLADLPERLRIRFARFTRLLRTKLKIVDGTEGEMTVSRIEEIWDRERNRGFAADAVLIDYDDEIKPSRKQQERRFEFADIYRELRQFASRRQLLVWTAAQTGRQSEGKKVITAAVVAEDISKVRKVSFAVGVGQGEWGERSRYLYVTAHKFDRQHVGCTIISDPDRAIFYDRAATLQRMAAEQEDRAGVEEE